MGHSLKKSFFSGTFLVFTCALFFFANFAHADWQEQVPTFVNEVEELAFLKSEAERLGVHAYLTGGTASSLAFHLHDGRDQKEYGKNFRSIFSRLQDLDILIDGDAEKSRELEASLNRRFPYLLADGNKPAWEVNPIFESKGVKISRVANDDFLLQNNDSISRATVEITTPPAGEPRVRDLAHWENPAQDFLASVDQHKIDFYRNPRHGETAFFKEGRNPELISALRYLQKALRHGLTIPPADEEKIKAIVKEFKESDLANPYVTNWLKHNGKKLFLLSADVGAGMQELNKVGMLGLLKKIGGNPDEVGSVAWLASRVPLPAHSLGQGTGKTAAELGLPEHFYHFTQDEMAYENLSRSAPPFANAFQSRNEKGELAANGEGFYLAFSEDSQWKKNKGAFTVPYRLDPKAVEGGDFELRGAGNDRVLLVKNRNALTTLPTSPDPWGKLGLWDALDSLKNSDSPKEANRFALSTSRLNNEAKAFSGADQKKFRELFSDYAFTAKHMAETNFGTLGPEAPLYFLLSLPLSAEDPELRKYVETIAQSSPSVSAKILSYPHWYSQQRATQVLVKMIEGGHTTLEIQEFFRDTLTLPHARDRIDVVEHALRLAGKQSQDRQMNMIRHAYQYFPLSPTEAEEMHTEFTRHINHAFSDSPQIVLRLQGRLDAFAFNHSSYPEGLRRIHEKMDWLVKEEVDLGSEFCSELLLQRYRDPTLAKKEFTLFSHLLSVAGAAWREAFMSQAMGNSAWAKLIPELPLLTLNSGLSATPEKSASAMAIDRYPHWQTHPEIQKILENCHQTPRVRCIYLGANKSGFTLRDQLRAKAIKNQDLVTEGKSPWGSVDDAVTTSAPVIPTKAESIAPAATPEPETHRLERGFHFSAEKQGDTLVVTVPHDAQAVELKKAPDGSVDCRYLYRGLIYSTQIK